MSVKEQKKRGEAETVEKRAVYHYSYPSWVTEGRKYDSDKPKLPKEASIAIINSAVSKVCSK